MSGESTPLLTGTIPAFEMFMMVWENLTNKKQDLKRYINIGLEWATKYYAKMDNTRAYIIAMCEYRLTLYFVDHDLFIIVVLNPSIKLTWIWEHWEEEYIVDVEEKVRLIVSPL